MPIYQDLAQPAVQEVGKGLHTVAKTVHIVLAPVKVLVWGYEQLEDFLSTKVAEKLSDTPKDEVVEPKLHVAGPALDALRFTGYEEALRELYANLLAASMDAKTASTAHPGFVEIIKQLTPDEARLLKLFSTIELSPVIDVKSYSTDQQGGFIEVVRNFSLFGRDASCEHPHLTPSYLNNLTRLGLVEVRDKYYVTPDAYKELEEYPSIVEAKEQITEEGLRPEIEKKMLEVTNLGKQFMKACVVDHREVR